MLLDRCDKCIVTRGTKRLDLTSSAMDEETRGEEGRDEAKATRGDGRHVIEQDKRNEKYCEETDGMFMSISKTARWRGLFKRNVLGCNGDKGVHEASFCYR